MAIPITPDDIKSSLDDDEIEALICVVQTQMGDVSSPAGDGNADVFISSDRSHPSELGHRHIGTRLSQDLFDLNVVI